MADSDEVLQALQNLHSYAANYRKDFEDRAEELYTLYASFLRDPVPGRSNLFIPKTFASLAAIRAREFEMLVGGEPWIDFLEVGADDRNAAKIAASFVEWQSDLTGFRSQFWAWLTNMLVYPTSVGFVGWRYETRNKHIVQDIDLGLPGVLPIHIDMHVEVPVIDDNAFTALDFWDVWPDPFGKDVDSCRYMFHREWKTDDQLMAYIDILKRAGMGKVMRIDWKKLRAGRGGITDFGPSRRAVAVDKPQVDPFAAETLEDDSIALNEVMHYWQNGRHAVMVNRSVLVYDGPNPYEHGLKPFVAMSYEPVDGEFYGISLCHLAEHLQHELNTTRNQRIDNVALGINHMWSVLRSADIDESELQSRANGIVHVDSHDDLNPLTVPDMTRDAYNEEAIISKDIDEVLATPAMMRGGVNQRRETATAMSIQSEGAGARIEAHVKLVEERVLKRIAYLYDMNNKQFVDQPRMIRMFGDSAADWVQVDLDTLRREFTYQPASGATNAAANKSLRREQLKDLTIAFASNPVLMQNVNMKALTRLLFENYDFRNLEELLTPEPSVTVPGMNPLLAAALAGVGVPQVPGGQQGPPPPQALSPAPAQGSMPPAMIEAMLGQGGSAGNPA